MIIDYKVKRATAAQWAANSTIHEDGVMGVTTDAPYAIKLFNGVDIWSNLPNMIDGSGGTMTAEQIESLLDTYYSGTVWRTQLTAEGIETLLDSYYGGTAWRTGGDSSFTSDEIAGVKGANNLSDTNPAATMADVVSASEGGNPNYFYPTLSTDFTSPDPSNANKVWVLRAGITIDANCDFSSCAGVKFKDEGGKVDFATYDVIFNDANFLFDFQKYNTVLDFSNGATINDTSTFSTDLHEISLNHFGIVGDGDLTTNTGTDNLSLIRNVQKISHYTGCDIHLHKGNCMYTPQPLTSFSREEPLGMYITNGSATGYGASLYIHKGAAIGALTNSNSGYCLVGIWNNHGGGIHGQGKIHGDWLTHDFVTGGTSEGCLNVICYHNCKDNVVDIDTIEDAPGDNFDCGGDPFFSPHYNSIVEAIFTKGFEIGYDGVEVANSKMAYSNKLALTADQFQDYKFMVFGGGGYAGTFGLDIQNYYAAFYDASDNFLGRTSLLETYARVNFPEGATQVSLIIWQPLDWSGLAGTLHCPTYPINFIFGVKNINHGVRQGASNFSAHSTVKGCRFEDNGQRLDGTDGSPGFGIDLEDGYQILQFVNIEDCVFKNNKRGDVILKGARYTTINDCSFENDDKMYDSFRNPISLCNGRYTKFTNNVMQDKELLTGRGDTVINNVMKDCKISLSYDQETISDCYDCHDTVIWRSGGIRRDDETSLIKDCTFRYHKQPVAGDEVFSGLYHLNIKDCKFIFDDLSSEGLSYTFTYATNVSLGSVDGMVVEGVSPQNNYGSGLQMYWYKSIKNLDSSINLLVANGLPQDMVMENINIKGWFDLSLSQATSDGSASNKIDIINMNCYVDDATYLGTGGRRMLSLRKDVDVHIKNSSFIIDIGNVAQGEYIMGLSNSGTTIFENTVINTSRLNTVLDLPTVATGGNITFIDCDFGDNITVSLRAGDKILYTKPNEKCALYADNATALADMGAGYYYRDSATGEFKMTYTPI